MGKTKFTVRKVKVVVADVPNRVGALARVTGALKDKKVNIRAICAYEKARRGLFVIWPDNLTRALRALTEAGIKTSDETAIFIEVPDEAGMMARISSAISEKNVNVNYAFATTSSGKTAGVIIKTEDDATAIRAIRKAL